MAGPPCTIKIIETSHASPPPATVPTTLLPLTFFDYPWLLCRPMQRLFFYKLPHSTLHFTHSLLPSLRSSLSLTLQAFYPFAAKLFCPPPPNKPYILYTDGDYVPFTVAETSADFDRTIGNHARDVKDLHPFAPKLPPPRVVDDDKTRVLPLLAVQVTVFPNSGICVGATFCHVAADGRSFGNFMKAWAAATVLGSVENSTAPFLDRSLIKEMDRDGLESTLLNQWWRLGSELEMVKEPEPAHDILANKVRATFVMGRAHIERVKRSVSNQSIRASTFVVSCAFVWTCLVKAQQHQNDDGLHYFCFVADCRNRRQLPIPATYFGNCLAICFVRMKRSELVGENGVIEASKAIGNRVLEFENGVLKGAEKWVSDWTEISGTGRLLTVSGSPKLRAYDTDFGWGKPKKTEVVHIDGSGALYMGDSRDEEGGIEFGLALKRDEMEAFNGLFEQGLKAI